MRLSESLWMRSHSHRSLPAMEVKDPRRNDDAGSPGINHHKVPVRDDIRYEIFDSRPGCNDPSSRFRSCHLTHPPRISAYTRFKASPQVYHSNVLMVCRSILSESGPRVQESYTRLQESISLISVEASAVQSSNQFH